jgi:tetratricopeptide (TPR) repeat protein
MPPVSALGLAYATGGIETAGQLSRRSRPTGRCVRHARFGSADYAATQNLGNAYRDLAGVEHHADNLRQAVGAYQEALRYRTPDVSPQAYAATQNNLGTAYRALAENEDTAPNLRRAITVFETALHHYTPQRTPFDYAATRNNLGSAYRALAQIEDKAAHLDRALAAFEEALQIFTPERAPLDYATTQANLGLVQQDLGDKAAAVACWREAERCFRQMGVLDKAAMMLEWIAHSGAGPSR